MRLFLASQDLGDYADTLSAMVGDQKRALIIGDARDYYQDEQRIMDALAKTFLNLQALGIHSERLDLRQYFGRHAELADYIKEYRPGLIFSIGGSVYCLATALHASGMDEIIRQGVQNNNFVYGGYSAGSMVASNDLSLYFIPSAALDTPQFRHRNPEITLETYGIEPSMHGLGLINQYVVPHTDRACYSEEADFRVAKIQQSGATPIPLKETDVFVVRGAQETLLSPESTA